MTLWKFIPTCISKGKIGKPVEFGRKWIINCYQGGYVLLKAPDNPKFSDQHSVIESLSLHTEVFETMLKSYATDRGMSSIENIEYCLNAEIEKIGIQPKGKQQSLLSKKDQKELSDRRAGIEPRIAHLKTRGLGRSRMKTEVSAGGSLVGLPTQCQGSHHEFFGSDLFERLVTGRNDAGRVNVMVSINILCRTRF